MRRISSVVFLAVLFAGCGTTGPSVNSEFPAFYLQDITTGAPATTCCFLGGDGDAFAGAGTAVYFIDREAGYVRAELALGVPVTDVQGSPEGGYGLAISGNLMYVIANDIYSISQQVLLPQAGSFIVPKPGSNAVFVICTDGTMVKIETVGWTITRVESTDLSEPVGAVLGSSGEYIFAADSDGTVYKLSTVDFSTAASDQVEGGINGMCSTPLGEVFVSPVGRSEVWAIDCGTGQHSRTFTVPGEAGALAATGTGKYFYATIPGQGFAIVNTVENSIEAVISSFGEPTDMSVNTQTTRAILCSTDIYMLQR